MIRILLLIGFGGFLGSIARFLTVDLLGKYISSEFPLGTFVVNVLGSLIIGLVYGIADRTQALTPEWRLFLASGFCGGYTTFSSFSFENFNLLRHGDFGTFLLYSFSSFALSLLAVFAGYYLSRL